MTTITQGPQGITISGIDTPAAPTVTNVGTAGSTTYTYAIVAFTANGAYTAAGSSGSTTTGNAALSESNYNHLTRAPVIGAAWYDIYCSVGASPTGKVGTSTVPEFDDKTGVGDSATAPTEGVTDALTAGKVTARGTIAMANTITVATDKKIQFRDTGLYIQSGADGKLTISADGSGADDITLAGTVTVSDDLTLAAGKGIASGTYSKVLTTSVSISAADIVATGAGKFGHAAGYPLVADPGAGLCVELVSAVMSFTYGIAQYANGGNVTVNINGAAALTGVISAGNSVGAAASNLTQFVPLATAGNTLTVNKGLNLVAASAFTNPGTATGTIKVFVTYRVHTL